LKEEYTILTLEEHKKVASKEEEEIVKERVKDWIEVGYHIHVAQAFKIDHSHGKLLIFLEKLKGKTLRDWISEGFFSDKNKYLNSKRVMNCFLQMAVGLNYIHKRGIVHQCMTPDNIYVENDRILKIGNICSVNLGVGKMVKNCSVGGPPEYWSSEQGYIFDYLRDRAKEGNYLQSIKLLPALTLKSDIYQVGLILLEMLFSERRWARGDRANLKDIYSREHESNLNKEATAFIC
jgi:serine/threonine protein kinase